MSSCIVVDKKGILKRDVKLQPSNKKGIEGVDQYEVSGRAQTIIWICAQPCLGPQYFGYTIYEDVQSLNIARWPKWGVLSQTFEAKRRLWRTHSLWMNMCGRLWPSVLFSGDRELNLKELRKAVNSICGAFEMLMTVKRPSEMRNILNFRFFRNLCK